MFYDFFFIFKDTYTYLYSLPSNKYLFDVFVLTSKPEATTFTKQTLTMSCDNTGCHNLGVTTGD